MHTFSFCNCIYLIVLLWSTVGDLCITLQARLWYAFLQDFVPIFFTSLWELACFWLKLNFAETFCLSCVKWPRVWNSCLHSTTGNMTANFQCWYSGNITMAFNQFRSLRACVILALFYTFPCTKQMLHSSTNSIPDVFNFNRFTEILEHLWKKFKNEDIYRHEPQTTLTTD